MEQVFSEQERKVFSYWNGVATVHGDPLLIYRRFLKGLDGDPNPVLEQMGHEEPGVWVPAVERLMPVLREAFDMAPFDPATGQGATEGDCLAALAAWQAWMQAKKERAAS